MLPRVRALLHTPEPPQLGPKMRPHVQAADGVTATVGELARELGWPARQEALVRAAALLWHDHLEAAHRVVQDLEDADGCWIHGIVHRREPDFWNARYWFRRVGDHPALARLTTEALAYLETSGEPELALRVLPGGRWDALAFVNECQRCAGEASVATGARVARELQRIEFEVLVAALCGES